LIWPPIRRPAAHNLPQWTADLDISSFDLTILIDTMKRGVNIEDMSMDGFAEALPVYEV